MASSEAKNKGFDDALLLDIHGNIAEGPGANFFFEKDGFLFTAPPGNILPGITRATIIEICKDLGITVAEKLFKPEEVKGADSAFFTGTAVEVSGINSLDGVNFILKWEDSIGAVLQEKYTAKTLS